MNILVLASILQCHNQRDDTTLQTLYTIAEEQTVTRLAAEQSTSEVLPEVYNQTNSNLLPDILLKKRLLAYALCTQTCKYKCTKRNKAFVESMSPPPELSDEKHDVRDQLCYWYSS
ncbi:hypothetical protein BDB01DRAFT_896235 [Pilobolus umbonatus]|nr:hypothetical protein BDB01DRAFT_896235 [Pilobolus umbonatus]